MTRYKDELFHYSTKSSAAQPLRKKKRVSAEEDTQDDDVKASKKGLSRRQLLLQALQKNPTKIGADADEPEEEESDQDLSDKSKRKKLASKSVKGKPRFPSRRLRADG